MTFIAVSIAVRDAGEVPRAIERAKAACAAGAGLIEWRLDSLAATPEPWRAAETLVRQSPAPCIVTCRSAAEGGEYVGADDARIDFLVRLARLDQPPRFIDVELAAFKAAPGAWRAILPAPVARAAGEGAGEPSDPATEPPDTSIILSSHDLHERPSDLLRRIESMTNEPFGQVVKVAWHARSLRDNLEAFTLIAERRKPTIALCMGPFGLLSRVLAPKFGGFVTFASDAPDEATAPGQPTVADLAALYRFDRINAQTRVYGVIGWPVEHSLGPLLHNAAFAARGWSGAYLPLPIPGDSSEYEHFKATVGALVDHPGLDFRGASVTIPHKENLLRFVRERGGRIDPLAVLAGAANTLVIGSSGAIACRNTDAPALVETLADAFNREPRRLAGLRIAVIGAGGVARAAIAGLLPNGVAISVFNRTRPHAEALAAEFARKSEERGDDSAVEAGSPDQLKPGRFDVVINCTPVGMSGGPAPDLTPLDALGASDALLDDSITVFDTVYAPSRTPLVAEAESRGARVVLGIDLFLRQAALQYESWTGDAAPIDGWKELLRNRQ